MAQHQAEALWRVAGRHQRGHAAKALPCQHRLCTVRPPPFRVFGAKGWQQAFGNVEHQLAATAEYCDAFTRVDVINAEYGHRRDASAADGGVNGGAYPKMVEPDLAIREYQQAQRLYDRNVRKIQPHTATLSGEPML